MTTTLKLDGSRLTLGDGIFDSDCFYLRKVADSGDKVFSVALGPTIGVTVGITTPGNYAIAWRWRSGSATQTGQDGNGSFYGVNPPDGYNTEEEIAL